MNLQNHMKSEKLNLRRHPRCNFTIPEELEFVERYKDGETFSSMAEEGGVSRNALWKLVTKTYNVEPYQTRGYPGLYDVNTKAFENINNEKSAYALGLIATDGHIYSSKNQISFDSTDKEQIMNLKECLDCTMEPYTYEPRTTKIRGREVVGKKKVYKLMFGPKKICNDFLKYFNSHKSNRTSIPSIVKKSNFVNHFVRGVIDGDGCVSNGLYITGNRGFLKDIRDIMTKQLDIKKTKLHRKSNAQQTYDFQVRGKDDLLDIYNWLYSNANYFLSRKKNKFEEML